jgi:hypothetical protein
MHRAFAELRQADGQRKQSDEEKYRPTEFL